MFTFFVLLGTTAFAQTTWYVNNTTGDDLVGVGTTVSPYKTIGKAITVAAANDIISIASDTYGEANVAITKALTFVATTYNSLSTVTITNGINVNTTPASAVVVFGVTGQKFNLGSTATALKLTAGNLQITSANVIIAGGGTITRTAGTLDNTPTVTNVNVTYDGAVDISAGAEMPGNIGSGLLTVNITGGKKATFNNSITTTGGITITSGNADFNALDLASSTFTNSPANTVNVAGTVAFVGGKILNNNTGTLTFNGNVTWTHDANIAGQVIDNANAGAGTLTFNGQVAFNHKILGGGAGANWTATVRNNGTGTLKFTNGFTTASYTSSVPTTFTPLIDVTNSIGGTVNCTGPITANNVSNVNAGTINLTGGTIKNALNNGTSASTVNFLADFTISGATIDNTNAGAILKLNTNTLTLSNNAALLDNTGGGVVISATAATIGGATVAITGTGAAITAGEVPSVTVASGKAVTFNGVNVWGDVTSAGSVTLAGSLTVRRHYTQNVGGTFTFGANTMSMYGNWTRSSNVPGDVTINTGLLEFVGATAQTFTPGASLQLYDVTINKTNATDVVTLGATFELTRNLTITLGKLDLGDYHLRMVTAGGTFTNTGGYQTTGTGYIIVDHAGNTNFTGVGVFSNLDIRGTATVTLLSAIDFSGIMNVRTGATLTTGAFNVTMKSSVRTVPLVNIYNGSTVTAAGAGVFGVAAGVLYDLEYLGDGNINASKEWIAAGIRNLTINVGTSASARTVTGRGFNTDIKGILSVSLNQTLELDNGGVAYNLTLSGNSQTHTVTGKVLSTLTTGKLIVTGDAVTLNGTTSSATGSFAEVPNLEVTITAGQTFTSNNLKKVTGNLTVANGTSAITMSTTTATITGNVTLTAGSLNLDMGATTSAHGGNLVLIAGTMTYKRGSTTAQQNVPGTVTLTAGTLTLGSSLNVSGQTTQAAGNLNANGFTYTQLTTTATNDYNRTGAGTFTSGTLVLSGASKAVTNVADPAGPTLRAVTITGHNLLVGNKVYSDGTNALVPAGSYTVAAVTDANTITLTGLVGTGGAANATATSFLTEVVLAPGATFSVPNVETIAGNNSFGAAMEVTNSFIHTSGRFNYSVLTLSGNTYLYKTGTALGTLTLTGAAATATLEANLAIPSLVVNSNGTVNFASNNATPRTITTSTAYTNTKGAVTFGINNLTVGAGTFTWTAGTLSQTDGILTWNTAGVITLPTTGFSVPNLTVSTDADPAGTPVFTVTKNLVLNASLTTAADNELILGDGILVTRSINGGVLSHIPTFGTNTDVKYMTYTGPADINTAKELPASVRNLTVMSSNGNAANNDGVEVILDKNITVTGTLSLDDKLDAVTNDRTVTMGVNSELELKIDGTVALDKNLVKNGAMNLVYNGATITTVRELGAKNVGNTEYTTPYSGNITFKSAIALDAIATFTGSLKFFNASDFTVTGQTVNIQGDLEQLTGATGFLAGTGSVVFNGATNTNIILKGNEALPVFALFEINKTNANNSVTLSGGNLTFNNAAANTTLNLTLTKGVFKTDATSVFILEQDASLTNQPMQGFVRTSGVVFGNIRKFVDKSKTVDISKVEFPTGDGNGNFKPAYFYFKTAPQASINMTVNFNSTSPGGTNSGTSSNGKFPISFDGKSITNYPPFFWNVRTDLALNPSYKYDMELGADGYSDYVTDQIQNVAIIRRDSGAVANPWFVQGANWASYSSYTNSANFPVIKVIDAQGGIISGNGSIFSYSQLNKVPVISAPANVDVNENAPVSITWTVTDPDINQTPTFTGVVVTAVAPAVAPTAGTGAGQYQFNTATGAFTWTPTYSQSGVYTVTVTATDGTLSTTDAVQITVNDADVATTIVADFVSPQTVMEGNTLDVVFTGAGTGTITVSQVGGQVPVSPVVGTFTGGTTTGTLQIAPDLTAAVGGVNTNYTFTIKAANAFGKEASIVFTVTVTDNNQAPAFTIAGQLATAPDMRSNESLTFTYEAVDPDGVEPVYSVTIDGTSPFTPAASEYTINPATGVFTFTPTFADAGNYVKFNIKATDGAYPLSSVSTTTTIKIKHPQDKGDVFVDDGRQINTADANLILNYFVGTPSIVSAWTPAQNWAADVDGNTAVNTMDAYSVLVNYVFSTPLPDLGAGVFKVAAPQGAIDFGKFNIAEQNVTLPVSLSNSSNVVALSFDIDLGSNVEFQGVTSGSLPKGWMVSSNFENGKLRLAMVGLTPLQDGNVASLNFKLKDKQQVVNVYGSVNLNGQVTSALDAKIREIPSEFALSQNYPNPFNPTTNIRYSIAENSVVTLTIYNMLGQQVRSLVNAEQEAGYYTVSWDGTNEYGSKVASGIYIYRISAGKFTSTIKMNLLK